MPVKRCNDPGFIWPPTFCGQSSHASCGLSFGLHRPQATKNVTSGMSSYVACQTILALYSAFREGLGKGTDSPVREALGR